MFQALQFVKGAVARKDFVPALTHFRIENGRVTGYNGAIALSSPIDLDLTCFPRAVPFMKAIQVVEDTHTTLHLTETGRLAIRSGKFSAYIDCLSPEHEILPIVPEGDVLPLDGQSLVVALKQLYPFIAEDASRPWARGILVRNESAFATNNIILVEKWLGFEFPEMNIPEEAVSELIRVRDYPTSVQASKTSLTFHFDNGRWLRCQLLPVEWPDLSPILSQKGDPKPVTSDLFTSLLLLKPFLNEAEQCFIEDGKVKTSNGENDGAEAIVKDLVGTGCYNLNQLILLDDIATHIDFSAFPAPVPFTGDDGKLRGVIVGMRV